MCSAGEDFISQRIDWQTRYTFSAKEKDKNTGYHYFGARYYDSEISIFISCDPLGALRPWVSSYNYVQWNPLNRVDPTGMLDNYDEYKFDSKGNYDGKVEKPGQHHGTLENEDGTKTRFEFADPENDPKNINENTKVKEVSEQEIDNALKESGVNDADNKSRKYRYAFEESYVVEDRSKEKDGKASMDYKMNYRIKVGEGEDAEIKTVWDHKNVLFITNVGGERIAHNNSNFGNFLWGAGVNRLGIPHSIAKFGAHVFTYFKSFWAGEPDSKDDQFSIKQGYEWENNH